ncbi:DegT/DnrJ/EryC1/StrS family aminotransferase [Variovorax paradoxus]|uniref:DegT/DnrJ/EryC1/StrS family aminotransferase n=1 Tax=Variovorax paradoxus TaxID=34073 RepID=UPI0021AC16DA|nr:DegT/DnrJ/EryC1/StrS family aminotransferase [Variovorax paradoxus]UVH59780.1 DegT/DnrJ/EryC1/StrS family aminotransferase [Variovorax paradoxus]
MTNLQPASVPSFSHWEIPSQYKYPFVKPKLPALGRLEKYFEKSRQAGYFSNFGPVSYCFEEALKSYFPGRQPITCANCTVGLSAALVALRVQGAVLVPAFTFAATASAVRAAGLDVVLGDIDPRTGVLDADGVEDAVQNKGCRAVIAVRPYGIWSDLSPLEMACRKSGVPLIVDGAAALGVTKEVISDYSLPDSIEVFSLHSTKPFGVGEGGLIVAPARYEDDLRSALNFGLWADGRIPRGSGFNGKMDELTASMACATLEDIPARIKERQDYAAKLNRFSMKHGLVTFCAEGSERIAPWQCFPIRLPKEKSADRVVALCATSGLQVRRYYHPLGPIATDAESFPAAAFLSDNTVCLPVYDDCEPDTAEKVWEIFWKAVSQK